MEVTSTYMNFLIVDVIKFVSGTMITFSQGVAAIVDSKQFSEFGPRTIRSPAILASIADTELSILAECSNLKNSRKVNPH